MAQKYYNVKEVAEVLGITSDDVKHMLDHRELYGYRDGADWKFKVEEIDQLAKQRAAQPAETEDEQEEVLLSEVELGQSSAGASGTVIGMLRPQHPSADSDLQLADSGIKLFEGGMPAAPAAKDSVDKDPAAKEEVDTKLTQFENLDLTLDEGLTLEESGITTNAPADGGSNATMVAKANAEPSSNESSVDLTGKELEDDDLVLGGGSGAGSDVTIGGDSGISLVDPTDSGLSLEEPLNLGPAADESLELGEDDLTTLPEASSSPAPSAVKADDDFLLTPLEEAAEGDDSESGSQVIALDTESDDSATIIASSAPGSMAAMLDEDLSAGRPPLDLGGGTTLGDLGMGAGTMTTEPVGMAAGVPIARAGFALPEAPYKTLDIVLLGLCVFVLMFCGMFMFDLLRNMHYWDTAYSINSAIMDLILGK
jgi:excisionase family DNA binding protein